jgi:TetR/AcrR family transcriptional repressor of mexJK operon
MQPIASDRTRTPRHAHRTAARAAEQVASIEKEIAGGTELRSACRRAGVSVASYYRWRARARSEAGLSGKIRETILNAAKTVFLRDGYGASLDSIAETARVARQTVYNQFGSKERLFAEVIQSVYQRMLTPIFVVARDDDLISTLTEVGRHLMKVALHPDSLALERIAVGEYRDRPELMRIAHTLRTSHAIPALTDYLAEYLRMQMAAGVIETSDPLLAAEVFLGSLIAQARYRLSIGVEGDSPERLETRLRFCVRVFARGVEYRAIGGRQVNST